MANRSVEKAERNHSSPDYNKVFQLILESKQLSRTGWVISGIEKPESVAEHTFGVSMLALVLTSRIDPSLDRDRLIKMSLLHDLAEIITGDKVVQRGSVIDINARDEKEIEEREGLQKILDPIGQAEEYLLIFDEMTARVTPEAQLFWQFDKLEMAMQAFAYETKSGKQLDEFFQSADLSIRNPFLRNIFEEMLKSREKRSKRRV